MTAQPSKKIRLTANRQDITSPDRAQAFLEFDAVSEGDIEVTVWWGEPEKMRGWYRLYTSEAEKLQEFMEHLSD